MFKRPFIIILISYIIGIIWGIYVKDIFLFFVIHIVSILVFIVIYKQNKSHVIRFIRTKFKINVCIIFIIFSIIGFTHVSYKEKKFNNIYKKEYFKAMIISNVMADNYKNKYIAKLDNYNINIYILVDKKIKLEYGDYIEIKGKINEPQGQRNKYGFNYKKYLKSINNAGNLYVSNYRIIQKNKANFMDKFIYTIRTRMKNEIYKIVQTDNKYLLEAILLGNRENISDNIKSDFEESNLSHLLAISGTHIAIIITLLLRLLKHIKIGKRKGYYINILILYLYMHIAGLTPSVTRACTTIILIIISKLIHRKSDTFNNISLSMFIILVSNPFIITNLSFILSYGGTFGIITYNIILKNLQLNKGYIKDENLNQKSSKIQFNILIKKIFTYIKDTFLISICVQIVILLIIINSFNKVSFTFFISNIIASPLLVLSISLGIITIIIGYVCPQIGIISGKILNKVLDSLVYTAKLCSKIPFSNINCIRIDMPIICIYYCILIYITYLFYIGREHIIKHILKKYYIRILTGLLIIILITSTYNNLGIKDLKMNFIDVGQGDASLIITPCNKTILIDGGGDNSEKESKIGKKVVLPYLLNNKISSIDYIIISHFDNDHVRLYPIFITRNRSKKCYNRKAI